MNGSSDDRSIILAVFLGFGAFAAIVLLVWLTSPQTGYIAGYRITVPGIAWLAFAVFAVYFLVQWVNGHARR